MKKIARRFIGSGISGAVLAGVLAFSLACAAPEPTPTPLPPASPAPPVGPTAVPSPMATPSPGMPTPAPVLPMPTRTLPTPTPVSSGKPAYGGTMRMAANLDDKTMDPHMDQETWGRPVTYVLYNTVVGYDTQFGIIPELARSWEFSADGKTITFHLAPGIKFQDGTPLDAEAVKWSLERLMNPEVGSPYRTQLSTFVEKVSVADPTTFAIQMFEPIRPILATLGDRPGFIVPKSKAPLKVETRLGTVATAGFGANPVGSGPFTLREWRPGSHIRVERWNGYWEKGKPYLDAILYQEVPEESSRLAMLRTGETDLIEVRATDLPLVKNNPGIKIVAHESGKFLTIELVVDVPPWNNKPLRQALAYSVDRQTIVDKYLSGAGRPAYISEGIGWAYNPDLKPIVYDPKKAKEKMVEAGFPSGVTVDLWCANDIFSIQQCEMYQAMGDAISLHLNVKPLPYRDFTPKMLTREVTSWGGVDWRPRADPDGRLRLLFHSKGGRAKTNYGYSNPEVDRLLDEAVKIYDIAKAKPLYDQVQKIITEDVPRVFVAYTNNYAGLNAKVQNFAWIPDFQWRLRDLWIER